MTQFANPWYAAGRLVQWGLDPQAKPVQEPEYRDLLDHYLGSSEFRTQIQDLARGLGLVVLEAGDFGFILGPLADSVFTMKPADFRGGTVTSEMRLLDGVIQVALATTVFPRAADLDEERAVARPAVTVDEVEQTVRALVQEIEIEAKKGPDISADLVTSGLLEAWRVYAAMPSTKETRDGRAARRTTRRAIEVNLEALTAHGHFVRTTKEGQAAFQPTLRYKIQVQDLAAGELYDLTLKLLRARRAPDLLPPAVAIDVAPSLPNRPRIALKTADPTSVG